MEVLGKYGISLGDVFLLGFCASVEAAAVLLDFLLPPPMQEVVVAVVLLVRLAM
jgi:hypothetical protein